MQNRGCGVDNIINEGKSYTFENPKATFIINRNLNYHSKNVVYIIQCTNCKRKKNDICCTLTINKRFSLHKNNIR